MNFCRDSLAQNRPQHNHLSINLAAINDPVHRINLSAGRGDRTLHIRAPALSP